QAGFPKIITVDIGNPENYQILDILGIPYTLVSPAAFAGVNLTQFDLLYVGWTPGATVAGMQALVDKRAEIKNFVIAGGGLVALSEAGTNPQDWQWLPFTIGFLGIGGDNVDITNPGHPVMADLTDADLSNWGSSFHNVFVGYPSDLEVLAIDGGSAQAVVLAGKFGAGRVLLTGLDPDWHFVNVGNPGAGVFLRNALEWAGEGVRWIIAAPLTGTVPVGMSMDIDIMFNAAGLIAGGYDANILIANNDPLDPNVEVPVHLHVTGAPDIVLSDTLFDYGAHFVGATIRDTLTVSNAGTDMLNVSSVSTDKPDYTVDVTAFALAPGASQDVVVTFSPLGPGSIPATLTLASDDPDEPTVTVALLGTGVVPPVMVVSPDSLVDSLFTGDVSTQVLTIDNSAGGSPLDFFILIRAVASATAVSVRGNGATSTGFGDGLRGGTPGLGARQRTITIPMPKDLGLNAFDPSAFQEQRLVPAAPAAAPRIITVNIGKPENYQALDILGMAYTLVTPAAFAAVDLRQYDLLYVGWTPGALSAGMQALVDKKADIDAFLSSGGGVVALSENGSNPQDWQWLPFSIGFQSRNFDFVTIVNSSHPVMAGLTSADLSNWGSSAHNVFTSLPRALEVLAVEGSSTQTAIVAGPVGAGRVVLSGLDPDWHLVNQARPGAAILLRNALEWAGAGVGWVLADPLIGTVAPGASANIDVTFDASGLLGGDYHAEMIISSNDPLAAEVVIPAHLNVTGAANIAVSTRLVTFPPLFIGGSDTRSIVVSNVGTDVLTVTGITSDNADYTVNLTNFNLNPGENRTIVVTFRPSSAGPLPGTLTIASNDIDEGLLAITLEGEGLVPPQIVTQPDSLHEALIAGDSAQQILTIRNPGGSDLIFTTLVTAAGDSSGTPVSPAVFGRGGHEGERSRFGSGLRAGVARDGNTTTAVMPDIAPTSAPDDAATGTAVVWLLVTPPSGTISAGDSLNITVTFNASTLLGGSFAATIQFSTNVPTQPIVTVPATLDVTGVPKIGVSTTLIDFGSVFIGFPDTRSIQVKNIGTDLLSVSGIVSSHPEFTIAPTTFDVPIGGQQTVNVTYAPTSVGAVAAIMTISSNDASQSTLDVDLTAEALVAPVIVVSDDSLKHVIQPGEIRNDTITVSNTGGSDLNWNLNVTVPTGSSPLAAGGMGGPAGVTSPGRPMGRAATAGVFNVLWHGHHGLGGIALWSIIISDITARGATVVENSGPITPSLLGGFDILWLGNTAIPFTGAEITAIVDWVLAGGSLLIEADTAPSVPIYEGLNIAIGSGIFYFAAAGFGGPTNLIHPHEMTSGVSQITLLGPDAQLILFAPAQRLVDDLFGQSMIAYSEVGSGRVVAMTDQPFHDVMIHFDDNRLLANQVFNWMAQLAWLTVTPVTGTVAPGGSVDIILNMDGTVLPPGMFQQNLNISSNDPATPVVTVAVQLVVDSTNVVTAFGVDLRVPVEFSLHQNYPNPLNPTTTIAYDLPAAVDARLVIYNVRGERIRELVNEFQQPGRYKIQWDGRNTRGESVASGVYFYRLKAGNFVRTRKMIMLK
ncbi:MAG: choice-of-anchor D domain-containing protein, partial [Candidatus Krumholzibacteria bacterium]